MESCYLIKSTKTVLYVSKLRFPKHPPYVFPFYMLILYNQLRKFQELFKIKPVPSVLLQKIVENHHLNCCDDLNNIVVINKNYLEECGIDGNFIKIISDTNKIKNRIAYVIGTDIKRNVAILSDNLKFNLQKIHEIKINPINPANINFASEIDLSLINTHHDLNNGLIDTLVKDYFKTPKIIRKNDLVAINFKKYAPEFFYTTNKVAGLKTVYFKCNKVMDKNSTEMGRCGLCIIGETTIKQSANIQDFVAPILKNVRDFSENLEDYGSCLIELCPYGLEKYLEGVERAAKPFLKNNQLQLKPAFLLQGSRGSGKNLIVSSLASKLGLHFYETTSGDVTASVYAQTETKIRNIFFRAKLCAPCILAIKNFENFGKNNEGQHDERIMSFFKQELENLFKNNSFPLILICISNSKEVPSELSRAFLEIFDITAPGEEERLQILKWICKGKNLNNQANLEEIAGKTHGFLFEDFQALVFYAQKNSSNDVLQENDFETALDLMQSKYSQSLGAPKIPKVQWSDVGGLSNVKHEIIRTINLPLRHPELLKATGLKRSGILLYGPPGTGKTLMAKAVATECNLCFLSVKGPELLNMYVGQSERNVREVFEKAREASPCIIFFDELDSLAPNRGRSGDSGGVMDRVVSQLLAEMDGLDQSATIFIIGATNRPDLIDPALLRPGRFDKLLFVGPCTDAESKMGVLKALTRKFKLGEDTSLREIVNMCPKNVTGADFYGLCSNAWMSAVRKLIGKIENEGLDNMTHENVVVTIEDFQTAIKDLKPSIKSEDLVYFENLQRQLGVGGNKNKIVNK